MSKQENHNDESVWTKFFHMMDTVAKWVNRVCDIAGIAIPIVFIVALVLLFKDFYDKGWSFHNNKKEIMIDNPYYEAGMRSWEEFDYEKAEESLLTALDQIIQSQGEGALEAAAVSQKLGALYLEIGRYEEGYERLNSAYVTFYSDLGAEDGNTIITKCQIGIYDIRTGNIERGFALFNEAYEETKFISYKIQIVQTVAQCNILLGDYKKAWEWYQQLETLYEKVGSSTQTMVNFYNDYGILMSELGEYDKALEYLITAVRQWQQLETEEDMTIANVYVNLAVVYAQCGQYENAIEAGERGISVFRVLSGDNSIHVARAYENIASVYGALRMPDTQIEHLEQALGIAESAVGKNHDVTAEIYNTIGNYYMEKGDNLSAISNYNDALEIRKNLLGKNSLITAVVYQNLAECYKYLEQYQEGMVNAREAVQICESLYGRDNIHTARAYMTLAWIYEKSGEREEAEELVEKALDIVDRHKRTANETTAQAYRTAGDIFLHQGLLENASDSYWKSWVIYSQMFLKEDSYAPEFDVRLRQLYEGMESSESYGDWVDQWKAGGFREGGKI